jgi:hypothetical protein
VTAANWLSRSPLHQDVLNEGKDGTAKTDRTLVSSVLAVQDKAEAGSSESPTRAETTRGKSRIFVDSSWGDLTDPTTEEALGGNAGLLATSYQRYTRIPKVPVDQAKESVPKELALSTVPERS